MAENSVILSRERGVLSQGSNHCILSCEMAQAPHHFWRGGDGARPLWDNKKQRTKPVSEQFRHSVDTASTQYRPGVDATADQKNGPPSSGRSFGQQLRLRLELSPGQTGAATAKHTAEY